MIDWLVKALATCGYLTYLPAHWRWGAKGWTGAGFLGSLAGLATGACFQTGLVQTLLALLGGFLVAVAVSDRAEELLGNVDDSRIVIDEWIGCWCAVAFLPPRAAFLWGGFFLFRIFDVTKLGWIERSGELPGGWGIVMDDILAGFVANACLQVVRFWM